MEEIKIRPFNKQCYQDLLKDMLEKGDGPFQCTVTVNAGNIVDYVIVEVVTPAYAPSPRKQSLEDVIVDRGAGDESGLWLYDNPGDTEG